MNCLLRPLFFKCKIYLSPSDMFSSSLSLPEEAAYRAALHQLTGARQAYVARATHYCEVCSSHRTLFISNIFRSYVLQVLTYSFLEDFTKKDFMIGFISLLSMIECQGS